MILISVTSSGIISSGQRATAVPVSTKRTQRQRTENKPGSKAPATTTNAAATANKNSSSHQSGTAQPETPPAKLLEWHMSPINPSDTLLVREGRRLNDQEQFGRALQCFNKALRKNPRDADAYCYRGYAYCSIGNFSVGRADLQKALQLNPKLADAYFYLGRICDGRTECKPAILYFEKGLKYAPTNEHALYSLAENLAEIKEVEPAIAVVNKLLKLYPNNWPGHMLRGNLYNQSNKHPEISVEDFNYIIKVKPEGYTRFYLSRAAAFERLRRFDKAIEDYTTVLKLNDDDDDTYNLRATAYEKTKNYAKAIEDYSRAISLYPEYSGSSYYGRGRCYRALGQNQRADLDFAAASKQGYKPKTNSGNPS